jgi:hypothetical protein
VVISWSFKLFVLLVMKFEVIFLFLKQTENLYQATSRIDWSHGFAGRC